MQSYLDITYISVGWHWFKAACAVLFTLVFGWCIYSAWEHTQSIHRHCTHLHEQEMERSTSILTTHCVAEKYHQDEVCVRARFELDQDKHHWIQSCELKDIKQHLSIDNPWMAMAIMKEISGLSYRFILVVAILAVVSMRMGWGAVAGAKEATQFAGAARRAGLPTVSAMNPFDTPLTSKEL